MRLANLASAAVLAAMSGTVSSAATVEFNGLTYELSMAENLSFPDNWNTLRSQFWWERNNLSYEFMLAAMSQAPDFFLDDTGKVKSSYLFVSYSNDTRLIHHLNPQSYVNSNNETVLYAWSETSWIIPNTPFSGAITANLISPIPLPAGELLLLTGLGGMAAFARRKKRTANAQ